LVHKLDIRINLKRDYVQKSLVDLLRSSIEYIVLIALAFASLISTVVTGVLAVFYFVIIAVYLANDIAVKIVLRMLRQRFPSFFRTNAFWRVGFPTQITTFFLTLVAMGLLGFKKEFGLTLQNTNEGLWLFVSLGLPFAILYSVGAFFFLKKSQNGNMPSLDFLKNPTDRIGTVIYTFTMPGVGEEILYRGIIQGYFSANITGSILLGSFPLMYSTIIASTIFILVHLYTMGETVAQALTQLPGRMVITLILGITFQLTGSLLFPIITHNVFDGFLVLSGIQATKN
jgi:membrane protease YdiL (CAAX protease family)